MSNALQIAIDIFARNTASKEFNEAGNDAQKMGREVEKSSERMRDATGRFLKSTEDATQAVDRLGASGGFQQAEANAKDYWKAVDQAAEKTENLTRSIEKVRNTGAAFAVAGAGGLMLSNHLADMGSDVEESENLIKESFGSSLDEANKWGQGLQDTLGLNSVEVRKNAATFNVMFDSMKFAKDEAYSMSKGLTELSYDMASFYNLSPDEAFEKLRGGITGEAEGLKVLGVLVNETTTKEYAYQKGIAKTGEALTEQQKVQARYGLILEQTQKAQGDLARTSDSAANVARRSAAQVEIAQQNMGKGASAAKLKVDSLSASLLTTANASPGLQETAGSILYIGSSAVTAVGGIVSFVAQLGLAWTGLQSVKAARIEAAIAAEVNTAATATEAAALTGVGVAAQGAAVGLNMMTLGVTALALGIGATVGWVAFAFGQHMGWIDSEQTYLERLTSGWYRLTDAILSTQNVAGAAREQNEKDFATEVEKVKAGNAKAVLDGTKTQSQADEDNRKAELVLHEKWAKENRRIGDDTNLIKHQEAMARLAARPATAPAAPNGTPSAAQTPTENSASDVTSAVKATKSSAGSAQKAAEKARKAAEKEHKAAEKAQDKIRKAQDKFLELRSDANSDVLIAKLDADTELKIKQLESAKNDENGGAIAQQIAQVKADKERKAAQIQAGALGRNKEDEIARRKLLDLADIKAKLILDLAPYEGQAAKKGKASKTDKNEPSMADAFSHLQRGGSIFDLDKATASTSQGGVSRETRSFDVPIHHASKVDAMGDTIVNFHIDPLRIPNPLAR